MSLRDMLRGRRKRLENSEMAQEILKVDLQNLINAMLRQYKNKYVVIREAIQNSVDAGAKHINVTIENDYIKVDDDGVGMDLKDISEYWNTLCRTSKRREKGAIEEFGLDQSSEFTRVASFLCRLVCGVEEDWRRTLMFFRVRPLSLNNSLNLLRVALKRRGGKALVNP